MVSTSNVAGVLLGGSINISCVVSGWPTPRVSWRTPAGIVRQQYGGQVRGGLLWTSYYPLLKKGVYIYIYYDLKLSYIYIFLSLYLITFLNVLKVMCI